MYNENNIKMDAETKEVVKNIAQIQIEAFRISLRKSEYDD